MVVFVSWLLLPLCSRQGRRGYVRVVVVVVAMFASWLLLLLSHGGLFPYLFQGPLS